MRQKVPDVKILNKSEENQILNQLNAQFGIKNLKGTLIKRGAERIFLFQGSLKKPEIKLLESWIPIERAGIYFAKVQDFGIRLSIDGVHLLKDQITKNVFSLNKEQLQEWMHGNELNIKTSLRGFVIMKYKDDFVGTGKASEAKITNFIPKPRRLKFKNKKN